MNDKKFKTQTGGLQEKKVKVEPTKDEVKQIQKAEKAKRKEKVKKERKERVPFSQRIRDLFGELRKVNWPTVAHTLKQTGVVLGVVLVFGVVLFGIDYGLGELYRLLIKGLTQ